MLFFLKICCTSCEYVIFAWEAILHQEYENRFLTCQFVVAPEIWAIESQTKRAQIM